MYQTKHDQCVSLPPDTPLAVSVSIIHRLHAIYLNRVLKQINLTAGQVPFLFQIAHSPGITQDEIAATAHIDKGTVVAASRYNEYLWLASGVEIQVSKGNLSPPTEPTTPPTEPTAPPTDPTAPPTDPSSPPTDPPGKS